MLNWLLSLFIGAALAANPPVITAPTGLIVLPSTSSALTGISIAEAGAGPTTQYTTTLVSSVATMTATGTNVSGSGTKNLSIGPASSAQMNTTLGTLAVTITTTAALTNDVIAVNATDNTHATTAVPVNVALVADGNKYLVFSTMAAAQARAQQQCTTLVCDGTQTVYWWDVEPTAAGGGAVRVTPSDPCFDYHVPPNAVPVTPCTALGLAHAGNGLTTTEQAALVTSVAAGLVPPLPGQ